MVSSDACQNLAVSFQSRGHSSAETNLAQASAASALGSGAWGLVFFSKRKISSKGVYVARLWDVHEVYDKAFTSTNASQTSLQNSSTKSAAMRGTKHSQAQPKYVM